MSDRMCTCSVHCPESPYHERACCEQIVCGCWCHQLLDAMKIIGMTDDEQRAVLSRYGAQPREGGPQR